MPPAAGCSLLRKVGASRRLQLGLHFIQFPFQIGITLNQPFQYARTKSRSPTLSFDVSAPELSFAVLRAV
jgi:hypothetical protein